MHYHWSIFSNGQPLLDAEKMRKDEKAIGAFRNNLQFWGAYTSFVKGFQFWKGFSELVMFSKATCDPYSCSVGNAPMAFF